MKQILSLILLVILTTCNKHHKQDNKTNEIVDYVNVFTGTDGPGNTYPGVVMPFGMVQLSPDNGLGGWDRIAGYFWKDSTIAGFSHKHLSGTGAGDMYDILVMPTNSRFTTDLWTNKLDFRAFSYFSHKYEQACPGYYAVDLLSFGIKAELTAGERVGFHRYTFPEDDSSKIIIDLGYALNWDKATKTYIKVFNDNTIVGYRFSKGWAADQREYFVVKLSEKPLSTRLYSDNKLVVANEVGSAKCKIVLHFETKSTKQIELQVALSSVSIEGAMKNLQAECENVNFDKAVEIARQKWNEELSCIKVEGSDNQKELFYTNLYHCFLTPSLHSDFDGKYKGANGMIETADTYKRYDTFSLWDTYRAAHPLYTIICPDKVEDFVKSFLAHYDETGLLPVWSMAGNETNMMIGYHSVPVIVDAYLKGIEMDSIKAYNACVNTAKSDAWDLDEYKYLGYVPSDGKNKGHWSVSKTLEYAYDDWCIAQMALHMKQQADYELFNIRSYSWTNHYDNETNFFRPKNKNAKFIANFIPKEYTEFFCESNAWQYFWHVPQHIDSLINLLGKDAFEAKLDSMFEYYPTEDDKLPIFSTGMIGQYAHGNEPSHHVAYLYNYIGKPRKTQKLVRQIIETQYSTSPDGYCGNEDCGQMSAWFVYSALGLYPVNPANGMYDITSPWVNKAELFLKNGKKFTITTKKLRTNSIYIKEILLNGKPYDKLRISHKQIMNGGELQIIMSN